MYGVLHLQNDVDLVHLSREMGGRGLIGCEGCIRMKENNFEWYVRNSVELLIEDLKAAETIVFRQSWMSQKKAWKGYEPKEGMERLWKKTKNVWTVYKRNAIVSRHWIPNPGGPCSNPLGGSKIDSAFHPSEVDKMSTRDFWKLSSKK